MEACPESGGKMRTFIQEPSAQFPYPLKVLTPDQILEIDRALESLGPFGEVRLVKVKGKLRFIQRLESRELPRETEEG